jgi:hypothetical protein
MADNARAAGRRDQRDLTEAMLTNHTARPRRRAVGGKAARSEIDEDGASQRGEPACANRNFAARAAAPPIPHARR